MDEKYEDLIFLKQSSFEGKAFLVFQSEANDFRVCEQGNYHSFNLLPGVKIKARVREKGCAGNEITELLHPHYIENKVYPFEIVRCGSLNTGGDFVHFLVVVSEIGEEFRIPVDDSTCWTVGEIVFCRLVSQRHGKLFFVIK